MPKLDSFWQCDSVHGFYQLDNAEREVLHPYTAKVINQISPDRLLDFGCGDGFLSTLIDGDTKIDLFDSSPFFDRYLVCNLQGSNISVINTIDEIESESYDCLVQSSVIMCCESKEELEAVFVVNHKALKAQGTLVACLTHPCFLQYEFGHYYTSFTHDNFKYLQDGIIYEVVMKSQDSDPVVFSDRHWSLSTVINLLIKTGFRITQLIEHPDLPYNSNWHNKFAVPWMIIIAEKK